ncbi:unnamed protein product [Ectocarpus sp. 4 AP-2014]
MAEPRQVTAKARADRTYDTPFTRETEPWGARALVSVQPHHPDIPAVDHRSDIKFGRKQTVSVVSYNVLADSNSVRVRNCAPAVTSWGRRREVLLKEILSVRADVLCLQDVDYFHQWWSPQLTSAGYDSLFKQRTSRAAMRREGVVIAWKRDVFDLFRSGEMELNRLGEHEEDRSLAGKAATSDNVALMTLLRPWQDSDHPSGACIVCTQLSEEEGYIGDAIRGLQARGLTRSVEAFNSDFSLPIVMCGSMNCVPSSGTYEILCRGIEAQDPARPGPPGKPLVEPISTSAARVRWPAPSDDSESLSPAIDTYRLLWVPGGSRFLPGESVDAHEAGCVVYDLVKTESGRVRSEQNPLRAFVVSGLSSGVAYEFRVSAINSLGQGPWSERSEPVRMPQMAGNDPVDKVLLGAASIKLLRKRELEDARRKAEGRLADPRACELRKLVKVEGLLDLGMEKIHPFGSVSGVTPRYTDAALHPDLANVRTDTGFPVIKAIEERRLSSGATSSTTRRRRQRKAKKTATTASHHTRSNDEQVTSSSTKGLLDDDLSTLEDGSVSPTTGGFRSGSGEGRSDTSGADTGESVTRPTKSSLPPKAYASSKREENILLRLESLGVSGARSERQKHALGLRSAYMTHSSGGEPAFTMVSDTMVGTVDYIFFSADCLLPTQVLSIPEIGSLVGRDIQQTELSPAPGLWAPSEWQGECGEEGYMGEWSPYLRENPLRVKHRIPNELFPSDHLMLMANLVYFEPRCSSTWR